MYWLILNRPYSPSLERASSCGKITVKSCITIEALIYGLSPKAITEKLINVPPEKMSSKDKNWFWPKRTLNFCKLITGTGKKAKNLNTKKINKVKKELTF